MQPKDFAVKITVKNNRILSRIKAAGFDSVSAFCRAADLDNGNVGEFILFKKSPLTKDGWRKLALDISAALGCYPADLWPKHMERIEARKSSVELSMDMDEVKALPLVRSLAVDSKALDGLLKVLTPREERVVRLRFGLGDESEKTLEEIGNSFGVSRDRIRQIEAKAFRKLQIKAYRQKVGFSDLVSA